MDESETHGGMNGVLEMGGMVLGALLALLLVVGLAYNFIYRYLGVAERRTRMTYQIPSRYIWKIRPGDKTCL